MKLIVLKTIRTALLLVLFIAFMHNSNAQNTEFGLRFMPTLSSFDMQTSSGGKVNGEATLGYGFGGLLGYNMSAHWGFQAEVIYSSISQKYKEVDVEHQINLQYLNIPLLLSLNTGKRNPINFNVVVGPQIGISIGSNVKTTGGDGTSTPPAVLSVKKGDLGFAYGAGLDFGLNPSQTFRLGLGFRGVYGLFDISDNSNNTSTDSYYILDRTQIKTYSLYAGLSILF